jgi:RNA 3'-terminal phosphate cyclase
MFADGEVRLKVKGGTDTKWSIPVDYFVNVILPHYETFSYFQFNDVKRGYYPKGQGFVDMTIKPKFSFCQIKAVPHFDLVRRTSLTKIKGISSASQKLRNAEVAKRQASGAKKKLSSIGCPVNIVEDSDKPTIGADALGEKGKRAEAVGAEAAAKLLLVLHSDAVVDSHLADNLVPLLALVGGAIKTDEITDHILSNVYVCEKFLKVRFAVDGKEKMIAV